jgi:DNA-binding transcriptional LysR family regulator
MDWKHVNFDWNHARAFLVVANEGSLSAAGRALNISQPTLGRQIAALETSLNVTLFERVGRGLSLTESGQRLYEYVKQMAEAANGFSLAAQGQSEAVSGHVCISLSELDAYFTWPPLMETFRKVAPNIQLEVVVSNQLSDLKRREADIAIRYQRPSQPDLIAKKLGEESVHLYGHKDYVKTFKDQSPSELEDLQLVGFDQSDQMKTYLQQQGWPIEDKHFSVLCNNQMVQFQLLKHGGCLAFLPDHIAVKHTDLVPAFPQYFKPIQLEAWLVCHRELHTSQTVRMVFDFLADHFDYSLS